MIEVTGFLIITGISLGAYAMAVRIIPRFGDTFIKANLYGIDLCKKDKKKIPESMGMIVACVFLVAMFLFIPIPYGLHNEHTSNERDFNSNGSQMDASRYRFPHEDFVELIAALLSICCMILLGFADDVLDLRWRHKLLLPTMATLPLLMVYYVNYNSTTIIMPRFIRSILGYSLDIGVFYYIYMGMLAVFCTNAINILAGINGLEVGQSIIIVCSILFFNCIELYLGHQINCHKFSIYLLTPFLAVSMALWEFNKYPAQVFVGDTFCYFAGMTFAVVGILGHFSKTLLLFFLPQIVNFLYSIPQLFGLVPCPRHRLPKYNSTTDKLEISTTNFVMKDLNLLGRIIVYIFSFLRLITWETNTKDNKEIITVNNFTLINYFLVVFGPTHESHLTRLLLGLQLFCTSLAFIIRYPLANYFYDT